jgi:hypothetical protein
VPWQDYTFLPDVILIPVDTQVTDVDLRGNTRIQIARGSKVNDTNGPRQATLLFSEGARARMVKPDGSTTEPSTLKVRATEYTLGPKEA